MPTRALVVIDVQNEYVNGNLRIEYPEISQSIANVGRAMDAARAATIPTVVVQTVAPVNAPIFAAGSAGADLHPEVARRERDHYILKALPSSFAGTDLGAWLNERQIDTLVVCGYMTHNCDFTTVSDATHAGYAVEFLADASGSVPYENRAGAVSAEELHRAFCVVMQSRFATVLTTSEWIEGLAAGQMPERDTIYGSNRRAVGHE
jgi:nicotinamidase-related amidase